MPVSGAKKQSQLKPVPSAVEWANFKLPPPAENTCADTSCVRERVWYYWPDCYFHVSRVGDPLRALAFDC
jgi:hypothetical protein